VSDDGFYALFYLARFLEAVLAFLRLGWAVGGRKFYLRDATELHRSEVLGFSFWWEGII